MTILISILASIAAFGGGIIALHFRDKLHIILGLSAGTVIGAALFDLIPESIGILSGVRSAGYVTTITALGFFIYLIMDRVFSFHNHTDEHETEFAHSHGGYLGAASFCLHSLIDGLAIGFAFQASATVGTVVTVAVIAHRFSDGINTIGFILRHHGNNRRALTWLTLVAMAPIVGAVAAQFINISLSALAILLALFAGFFLYIGASDLIPEGHHSHSKALTTIMTILGAALLYMMVNFSQI